MFLKCLYSYSGLNAVIYMVRTRRIRSFSQGNCVAAARDQTVQGIRTTLQLLPFKHCTSEQFEKGKLPARGESPGGGELPKKGELPTRGELPARGELPTDNHESQC